jgi:hypothetical protein
VIANQPDEAKARRATLIAWLGCGALGVLFVGLGIYSAIASATTADEGMRTPDLLMAFIGVVFGAITIVGAVLLRRCDPRGVRFASIILRFVLVIAAGNLVFSVVNGIGHNLGHFLWALIATVVTAALVGALEQLRTALTPPPRAGR